jgi:glutamate formiminotransferase/glutamate formiminotransferase/formiminotetrahydrofolate cyclodeaminase
MATRSPGAMPKSTRPSASSSTASATCVKVISCHSPSRLKRRDGASPKRSAAWRARAATVAGCIVLRSMVSSLGSSGRTGPPCIMSDPGHLMLLAVPNVSEGRDPAVLDAIGAAFAAAGARVLDRHADPDHHRAVFTLAGAPGGLAQAVLAGARETVARVDLRRHEGLHPHVGAVDVAPVVFRDAGQRGTACAEALVLGDLLGAELGVPVFLYGALAGGRTRAELRRGGPAELARRMAEGELRPDFGPPRAAPVGGAVLVAARPPLVAFNVELAAGHSVDEARAIAARIREGGEEGLPGVRAIGLELAARGGVAQVSLNVEDPGAIPLSAVVAAVARHAAVAEAELVGLAPRAAFAGFPDDVPVRHRATIEDALNVLD